MQPWERWSTSVVAARRWRTSCKALEDELQGLRDQLAKEVRLRQEQEEGVKAREAAVKGREAKLKKRQDHLDVLEKELEATMAELDGKARVLAEDRVAFKSLQLRSHEALQELYEKGLEKPLVTDDEGPAQLLP